MKDCFTRLFAISTGELQKENRQFEWEVVDPALFNELIISWDAKRPERGKFTFYVRVKTKRWSPWICYAVWGRDIQQTFTFTCPATKIKSYQDIIEITEGELASGFKIKVVATEGADFQELMCLYASVSNLEGFSINKPLLLDDVFIEDFSGKSQMNLDHHRKLHLCSPTSTSTVVNFLLRKKIIDPVSFANKTLDQTFDIYGNWALNVAEANSLLGKDISCCVMRLAGFEDLHNLLKKQMPVVVSVSGTMKGALVSYEEGHLIVVIGYNSKDNTVQCIDSAFKCDLDTLVNYDLDDFIQAWGNKKNLAYTFTSNV